MSNSNLNLIESMLKEILELVEEEKKNGNTVYTTNSTDNFNYNSNLRDKVVEIAKKYIGGKYNYGKKDMAQVNTIGVDCSGFTQGVYKEAGISVPKDAVNSIGQREWGTEVNGLLKARPGDLICYNGRHVAIYVGNNEIIDAGNEKIGITQRNINIMPILTIRNVIGD